MRGNETALKHLIHDANAVTYLSEWLGHHVPVDINLAAARLLTSVCSNDFAKQLAVRLISMLCMRQIDVQFTTSLKLGAVVLK